MHKHLVYSSLAILTKKYDILLDKSLIVPVYLGSCAPWYFSVKQERISTLQLACLQLQVHSSCASVTLNSSFPEFTSRQLHQN